MRLEIVSKDGKGERWVGAVLCHDLLGEDRHPLLRKGHRLIRDDSFMVEHSDSPELHLLWLDEGDVDEDTAAIRLARVVAGPGVAVHAPVESQVRLSAARRGLASVNVTALTAINTVAGVTVFTVPDGVPVERGGTLAGVKITELAIDGRSLSAAECCGVTAGEDAGVIHVHPFLPLRVAAVVRERLSDQQRRRFEDSLRLRVSWLGGAVASVRYPAERWSARDSVLAAVAAADVVIVAGVSSVYPLEGAWLDLLAAGATVVRRGLPVHPGSSYWVLTLDEVPIIGVASCGMLSRRSALDLLLPRCFAREPLDGAFLASLGHGGLLQNSGLSRIPSYGGEPEADAW